ncbi:crosslink repair DNA glycosylase YcaQ family protein, partial [Nocardioides sp.]|uniref:DNA glycosylase AlkZ-like family protein n=1 Tax=Nocardioides sp. TaxID=35761 RepID=UPI002734A681
MVRPGSPAAATPVRHVDDAERRARLARRHAVTPAHRVTDAVESARSVVCLHATEPATVYLSAFARVRDLEHAHVADALYRDRTLVKQLAMRRTLFAAPRDLLPAVLGSVSARVAGQQRSRLEREVEAAGVATDGPAWVATYAEEVLGALGTHGPLTVQELCAVSALLATRLGDPDGPTHPLTARVLTVLGAEGRVVRGVQELGWRSSRPRWTLVEDWLGERPVPLDVEPGYAELVRRWLAAFGPGTEDDLVWWSGSTRAAVRRALADLGAVTVSLDGGGVGHLLPDDVEPE